MSTAKRSIPAASPKPVAVPLSAVTVQQEPWGDTPRPEIPGKLVAALLDMATGIWGENLRDFADADAVELRARNLAGLVDGLIGEADSADNETLAVIRDGFTEMAYRVRAVAGRCGSYNVIAGEAK
jgi:hypothetical protein